MTSITETARAFFEACESGKGWGACVAYCSENATFSAQSEPLLEIKALCDYADWMKGLIDGPIPNGSYELKSFATDEERGHVCAYGVFKGTHTGDGGPVPATGKSTASDYAYVMEFDDGKISHMTKIWHSGIALEQLGWA
ncbi:MAG: nuclear transport factor 2 family protein [Pseudomonadota bacterium]